MAALSAEAALSASGGDSTFASDSASGVDPSAPLRAGPSTSLGAGSPAPRRFSRSLLETGGEALVVSQFTLLADVRKGRRPSFTSAASPEEASLLVDAYAQALRELGVPVATGRFGAHMLVALENDGPVTIVLDTAELDRPRRQKPST